MIIHLVDFYERRILEVQHNVPAAVIVDAPDDLVAAWRAARAHLEDLEYRLAAFYPRPEPAPAPIA